MANSNQADGEPALVDETTANAANAAANIVNDDLDLLPTATTTSFDAHTPYQILLLAQPPSGIAWYNFCRAHSVDMGAAHLLAREVAKHGVAVLGTWPRDEAREMERALREDIYGMGTTDDNDDDQTKKKAAAVRCIPAPLEGGGVVRVVPKENSTSSNHGEEPDQKKAKVSASSAQQQQEGVNPEIQRLYDEGIITSDEFQQMQQADRLFEAEVEAAPTTFAVQKFPSTNQHNHHPLPPALQFDYNNGRRPDVYDAYAHRHNPRFWVNRRLYQANAATLDAVCLVEFCRKYTVPKKGPSEGKIKYHRKGVITKTLRFHPEYSSDPNYEGGREYGKYCRFALVRYRPWVDAPFGRVEANGNSDGETTKATVECKPAEDECIRQWTEYLLELRERMHLVPDVLLPEELKGGGAGIELLVVPDVEGADEVEQRTGEASAVDKGREEETKGVEEEEVGGGGGGAAIQTLDDVIRAAEEAIGKDTNADAAVVSADDDDDDDEDVGDANDDAAEVDGEEDDILPSSFADMGEAADVVDQETFPFAVAPTNVAEDNDAENDDGINPFASFVTNKMSGDADDVAEEDNWLSSVMAAGAVAVDAAAAERSANKEVDAGAVPEADTADLEEDNAADDASLDSMGKMFDDAKKRLSGVMSVPSDAEPDEASEVASIAASEDSSQIEEMHNDFSTDSVGFTRKESDDNMAREEIDLAASISFVKEELDEVDAKVEAAAAAVLLQSAWRGHSARKSLSVSADDEATSEANIEKDEEGDTKAITPLEKAAATPSALTLKLEQSAAISPNEPEGAASISSSSTSPRNKARAPESLPFLAENSSSNFVSPRERELEELRDLVKGRATEGKERLESYAGQYSDEQSRIEELRSQADSDQHKINEIHRQAKKVKTTSSALLIQSAWRRHKAQEAFIQHRDAVREMNAQEEDAAAVVIQSTARGYNERQRYVALLQGCIALQAIARGSQARAIHSTKDVEPNVEDFHDSAPAEQGDTNLTDEYCPSNASIGEYLTAAEDDDVVSARKNKTVGAGKKLFGRRKSSKAKGYAEMMASDSESDDELGEIRQSTSFLGRKSLKTDGYYAEMLVDDYASESDVETTTSSPSRSSRSASPVKRRVKKVNDKEKDGRRKSVVGSLLRKGKGAKKKKSVVSDIVDNEDTTGSILLSARVPTTKPKAKPKGKKARRKKNKTRGVRETGPEEPEFWQGFAVDMEESDIESDMEDDAGSFQSSMQRHSASQIFDCRTIEEESFDEEEDFFASTTPRAQIDLSKDAVPENATTVTTEAFSKYVSNRFEFPEEPLVFNPDNNWQKVGVGKAPSENDDDMKDGVEEPIILEDEAACDDETPNADLSVDDKRAVIEGDESTFGANDEESAFGAGRSIASAVTLKASASLFIEDDAETVAASRSVPIAAAPAIDNGPGPLTQAAVMDSANIFPMENFRWNAAFPDEDEAHTAKGAPVPGPSNDSSTRALAQSASGEVELQAADSPQEVSAGDILVDLETTLQDEDNSAPLTVASGGRSRFKPLRRKKKTKPSKSKAREQATGIDAESLLSTAESDSAMNFGQLVPEEDEAPANHQASHPVYNTPSKENNKTTTVDAEGHAPKVSIITPPEKTDAPDSQVNVSIDTSIFDGVEVLMDADATSKSISDPVKDASITKPPTSTSAIIEDDEEMPIVAPSTITATRFRVRSLGRNYKATDDVEL